MSNDLDTLFDRTGTGSKKWDRYPDDVLPMWVADMDFAAPPAVLAKLQERLAHPVFGYSHATDTLRSTLVDYLWNHYAWRIEPQDLVFLPGVMPGVNMALRGLLSPGDGVTVQTPNYPPLRQAAANWKMHSHEWEFKSDAEGNCPADLPSLHRALADSRALLFSNPLNPVGKSFTGSELTAIADACLEHDVLILSDEIHADLQFDGRKHIPIASLSPQLASRSITFMSASKVYNIAGLKTAFAIIQNPDLRDCFNASHAGMVDSVNTLGLEATQAAYADCGEWLEDLQAYLQANRDYLVDRIRTHMPAITVLAPQSTYLAWLDCTALELADPQRFFLEHAKVGLSAGSDFGDRQQFVRLNFGCPRELLEEGLRRMEHSLRERAAG